MEELLKVLELIAMVILFLSFLGGIARIGWLGLERYRARTREFDKQIQNVKERTANTEERCDSIEAYLNYHFDYLPKTNR